MAELNDPALATRWQTTRAALTQDPYEKGEINQLTLYAWENEVIPFALELDQRMPRDTSRTKKDLYDLAARITDLQQTNVPFITDLYGRQIIDSLLATANAT